MIPFKIYPKITISFEKLSNLEVGKSYYIKYAHELDSVGRKRVNEHLSDHSGMIYVAETIVCNSRGEPYLKVPHDSVYGQFIHISACREVL